MERGKCKCGRRKEKEPLRIFVAYYVSDFQFLRLEGRKAEVREEAEGGRTKIHFVEPLSFRLLSSDVRNAEGGRQVWKG